MNPWIVENKEEMADLAERFKHHRKLVEPELLTHCNGLFRSIQKEGDEAIRQLTRQYDDVNLNTIRLSESYIQDCISSLVPSLRQAIEQAAANIREVNEAMLPASWTREIRPGTFIGEHIRPLDAVGLWIPARKKPLNEFIANSSRA